MKFTNTTCQWWDICSNGTLAVYTFSFQQQAYSLSEPGMKKQMGATNVIISEIERSHKCVIESNTQPEETDGTTKGDGGASSTMNLPYDSMSLVNDKEVKLASGHRITIVVGDLAQQKVYLGYW